MAGNSLKSLTFEEAIAELEEIVDSMESGKFALEESVKAYERGCMLAKFCQGKLEAAEATIQKLDADRKLSPLNFNGKSKSQPTEKQLEETDIPF